MRAERQSGGSDQIVFCVGIATIVNDSVQLTAIVPHSRSSSQLLASQLTIHAILFKFATPWCLAPLYFN